MVKKSIADCVNGASWWKESEVLDLISIYGDNAV